MSGSTDYLVTAVVTFPISREGELSELVARSEVESAIALWDGTLQSIESIEVDG